MNPAYNHNQEPPWWILWVLAAVATTLLCCNATHADQHQPEIGIASWYGGGEKLNRHTANGEVFDPDDFTCATYAYPFGTRLRVTNLHNHRSTVVRVNDRGPARRLNRIVDLSKASFQKIADLKSGLIQVRIEKLDP